MYHLDVLNILKYAMTLAAGLTGICGITFDKSCGFVFRKLDRSKKVAFAAAVLCLIGALVVERMEQVSSTQSHQAEIQRYKDQLQLETKTADDASLLAADLDRRLHHLDHLAVHVVFELPASDTRVGALMRELNLIKPDASPPGIEVYGSGVTYVNIKRLVKNPLPALAPLQLFFDSMSGGMLGLELRLKGQSSAPELAGRLSPTAGYCSLCYVRGTTPRIYARWETVTIIEHSETWTSVQTGVSIRDLTGAKLELVLFPQPHNDLPVLKFFSGLKTPAATVYFNGYQCLLNGLVASPDPAKPSSVVFTASLPDAGKIIDGSAMEVTPYLDLF